MATNVNELIFIKRVKKVAHAQAHGGAWKIAYADFVTAMMAFFLLMWLLNATTEDQRTAISNYFAPASVSKSTSGAGGVLGGRTLDAEGAMASNSSTPGIILGVRPPTFGNAEGNNDEESLDEEGAFIQHGPVGEHDFEDASGSHMGTLDAHDLEQGAGSHLGTVEENDAKNAKGKLLARADKKTGPDDKLGVSNVAGPKRGVDGSPAGRQANQAGQAGRLGQAGQANNATDSQRQFARREQRRFDNAAATLKKLFAQDPKLRRYKDNLRIEQIGAGMRIQLLDNHKVAMFPLGSAEMMEKTNEMMAKIAESIKKLPNKIAIVGHTDATPYRAGSGYSNWELSTDRAHASRRALIAAGLPEERLATVTGKAATDPLNKADPEAPSNRRISILLLREAPPVSRVTRSSSAPQSNPYSNYRARVSPVQANPVVAPMFAQPEEAAGAGEVTDPLEESLTKSEAAEEDPVEEAAPSAEPEQPEAEEPEAELEVVPVEQYEPEQDLEFIDNDLWQRL